MLSSPFGAWCPGSEPKNKEDFEGAGNAKNETRHFVSAQLLLGHIIL